MIRMIIGAPELGNKHLGHLAVYLLCDTKGGPPEALEQHAVRCPVGGTRACMHLGLMSCLHKVLLEADVPCLAMETEARGMRGQESREDYPYPSNDIVFLDYVAPGKYLLLDIVVTTAY